MRNNNDSRSFSDNRGGGGYGGNRGGGGGGYGGNRGGGGGRDGGRPQMHRATCSDCGDSCEVPFRPTAGKPVRCNNCFKRDDGDSRGGGGGYGGNRGGGGGGRDFGGNRGGGGGGRDFGGERVMHEATCADCGGKCEVPFRPTGSKPVFCSECFEKEGNNTNTNRRAPAGPDHSDAIDALTKKLDRILRILEIAHPPKEHVIEKKAEKKAKKSDEKPEAKKAPAKKKAVAKKAPAKKKAVAKKKAPAKKK